MSNQRLVAAFGKIGVWAVNNKLPFAKKMVEYNIYEQFVGGATIDDTIDVVKKLDAYQVETVLDYGVEAKSHESAFEEAKEEFIKAINFAGLESAVPVIAVKVSALVANEVLENWGQGELSEQEKYKFDELFTRVTQVCESAAENGVRIFVDAEETWVQDAIDFIADKMMEQFNHTEAVIYNTFQMYRHDRLAFLKKSHERAQSHGYILGAKLVRGAYMEKERLRAKEKGYESPICRDKAHTDDNYNQGLTYCIENYLTVASCAATHNEISSRLQADAISKMDVPNNHPHLNFCQLYGMSDHITFNLAHEGFNASKYVPYGPVEEVLPYLVRRAEENTAVKGDFSREYNYVQTEINRRKSSGNW